MEWYYKAMQQEKIRIIFFVTLLLAISLLAFFIFLPYLTALVLAGTLAIIFEPLYTRIRKFIRSDSVAALSTVFVVVIIVLIPLSLIGTTVVTQAAQLYGDITSGNQSGDFIHRMETIIQQKLGALDPRISIDFEQMMKQFLGFILDKTGSLFSGIAQVIFDALIAMLAFYYLLKDGTLLRQAIISFSPLADSDDEEILTKLKKAVRSVMIGTLVLAIVQGVLVGIGFYIFGVPDGALWGSIAGIAALIPFFGTSIVIIPAIIYLIFIGHIGSAIGLFIWAAFLVGMIDNILMPKLVERGTQLHPLAILLSVLGGISLFGLVGFLLGPLTLSLCSALFVLYKKQLVQKD